MTDLARASAQLGLLPTLEERGSNLADPADQRKSTAAIRRLNECIVYDDRVDMTLLPMGDGLTIARKK